MLLRDVRIVDTVAHRVCQVLPVPRRVGIALDSVHHLAYMSGLPVSLWIPTQFTLPGARGNDVACSAGPACAGTRVWCSDRGPASPGALAPQAFPPAPNGTRLSWPEKVAVLARWLATVGGSESGR